MKHTTTQEQKAIKKILIANRGEIALRIQRTAHKMNIATVAVYATGDSMAAFVNKAGESVLLEGSELADTYLNIDKIIAAARQTQADAIHPGYGFLSENPELAEACEREGILFIGPDPNAMRAMGHKIAARQTALQAGVPVVPGITGSVDELLSEYQTIGLPLLIKAAAGGGGKGMRVVYHDRDIKSALEATAREAKSYFGNDTVYLEKYVEKPRHIEVQILGDRQGNVLHLYERECSLQRRHQKIIEEAPCPTLSEPLRESICSAALKLAKSIGYYNAGTIEFLVDENDHFYFLEMNTRIQVEHPVTELITGVDIVAQQIGVAEGKPLSLTQTDIRRSGHAIECRIYAEDPLQNFLPSPGLIKYYEEPPLPAAEISASSSHPLVRIDGMKLKSGDTVSDDFDPMISKLIVWAPSREEARLAMIAALSQYHIKGIHTNIAFLAGLLKHKDFIENNISTKYIDHHRARISEFIRSKKKNINSHILLAAGLAKSLENKPPEKGSLWQAGYWRQLKKIDFTIDEQEDSLQLIATVGNLIEYSFHGHRYSLRLQYKTGIRYTLSVNEAVYDLFIYEYLPGHYEIGYSEATFTVIRKDISYVNTLVFTAESASSGDPGNIVSPMPGKIIKINVKAGDMVKKGDSLLIVEAMKMENNITSPVDGRVEEICVTEGSKVDTSTRLVQVEK